jgi:hypothetical protein
LSAYWLVLVLALGGVFSWLLFSLLRRRTPWPQWMQMTLSCFAGLILSGYLVLVLLTVLQHKFPDSVLLKNHWENCDRAYPEVCMPPRPPPFGLQRYSIQQFQS